LGSGKDENQSKERGKAIQGKRIGRGSRTIRKRKKNVTAEESNFVSDTEKGRGDNKGQGIHYHAKEGND